MMKERLWTWQPSTEKETYYLLCLCPIQLRNKSFTNSLYIEPLSYLATTAAQEYWVCGELHQSAEVIWYWTHLSFIVITDSLRSTKFSELLADTHFDLVGAQL